MFSQLRWGGLLLCLLALPADAADEAQRGKLLYATHCGACHDQEIHWREQRLAKDFAGLQTQVRRWQGAAKLNWSESDILQVGLYLNERYYHFSRPEALGLLGRRSGEGMQQKLEDKAK